MGESHLPGLFVNGLDDKFLIIERDVPDFLRKPILSQPVKMDTKH